MSGMFALEGEEFDQLVSAMSEYGEGASDIVSEVIHDSGDIIYQEIDPLIHPSGRTFKGHSSGAQGSRWQRYDTGEPLAITVAANARYAAKAPSDFAAKKHPREIGCESAICTVPDSISRLNARMVPKTATTDPHVKRAEKPASRAMRVASPNWW